MARTSPPPEPCPACGKPEPIAFVDIKGTEYGLCRACVVAFVCAHARLANDKPRK